MSINVIVILTSIYTHIETYNTIYVVYNKPRTRDASTQKKNSSRLLDLDLTWLRTALWQVLWCYNSIILRPSTCHAIQRTAQKHKTRSDQNASGKQIAEDVDGQQ